MIKYSFIDSISVWANILALAISQQAFHYVNRYTLTQTVDTHTHTNTHRLKVNHGYISDLRRGVLGGEKSNITEQSVRSEERALILTRVQPVQYDRNLSESDTCPALRPESQHRSRGAGAGLYQPNTSAAPLSRLNSRRGKEDLCGHTKKICHRFSEESFSTIF